MAKDYYDILGVSKNSSKEEIKKAFHKAAHKYHPDKNNGDDKKFKEVNEAYQTLSDDQKKAQYDRFGAGYQNMGGGAGGYNGGFNPNDYGFDFSGFSQGFEGADLGDIFSDFFGGGGNRRSQQKRGRDITTEMNITFEESIFGIEREVIITKTSTCNSCIGTGAKSGTKMKKCSTCNGQGSIRENKQTILGVMSTQKVCTTCEGQGEIPEEKCPHCKGHGVERRDENISIKIPAGINNGEMVRLSQMGEAVRGGVSGDLYIRVYVSKHKLFSREGNNLILPLSIKLTDALLGIDYTIETLDGNVTIKIPAGINHGEILRVKEKGVPLGKSKRGDLLIPIKIAIPQKLSKKEKELIVELQKEGL